MPNRKFKSSREMVISNYEMKNKKNPKFSKRSYAKLLGISSGRLAEIFSGKSSITEKKARSIANKLEFSAEEKLQFLTMVENETNLRSKRSIKNRRAHRISHGEFSLICEWEYFSLMSLIELSTFKSDKNWIAKKLGITNERLDEVINILYNQNLIKISDSGAISNTYSSMSTLTDVPSDILKKANEKCILQAIEKMYQIKPELRDITSMTFPVAPQKIAEAKDLIRKFKAKMTKLMSEEPTSEIYNLNIQLVPVTELGE